MAKLMMNIGGMRATLYIYIYIYMFPPPNMHWTLFINVEENIYIYIYIGKNIKKPDELTANFKIAS
jgi:hypothetical protein